MIESFSIKSVRSDAELLFEDQHGDYFTARLIGREVSGTVQVWGYTDCELLVDLLSHLANQKCAWSFPAKWVSIEGEFALDLRCDPWGHVFVGITMQHRKGIEEKIGESKPKSKRNLVS